MRTLAKPIQMIAWFDSSGKVNPIKFKLEQDEDSKVIIINKVINRELEKLAGNVMWKFTCISIVDGIEKIYKIKYDLIQGKWFLFL